MVAEEEEEEKVVTRCIMNGIFYSTKYWTLFTSEKGDKVSERLADSPRVLSAFDKGESGRGRL